MKKLLTFLLLNCLLFTVNISSSAQNINEGKKILKIGVLLPLSGEYEILGQSFLKSIQLALYDISDKKIKIYPKDSKANAFDALKSAKEFEKLGIQIVIGPIFHQSLEKLNEINNITFISLTNKTRNIPNNVIAFGINLDSQIDALKNYFKKIEVSKTILLSPNSEFIDQSETVSKKDILKFYRTYSYDKNPKKITAEIEKITKYRERKKDLERRIKILEKSELPKDKRELKKLEQMHTLGKVNFDSVFVIDFGERLKSVLTSFMFSDVPADQVYFFTVNQWFDKTFFEENAMQNLHFPSINYKSLKKFNKKYMKTYDENPYKVSILAYDALGLIYYCWINNDMEFKHNQLYNKNGFKGLHGEFFIEGNLSKQKLNIYKISNKNFIEVY